LSNHCAAVASIFVPLVRLVFWYGLVLSPESVIVGPGNARQEPVTGGGAVTVIAAVPLFPSLVAVIVAAPTVTPVTNPLPLTLAIPLLLDAHVTVRPVRTVPALSLVTALSWTA